MGIFQDDRPDAALFYEIIEARQQFLGMRDFQNDRYAMYPYPQGLSLLSDMNRNFILRECGDYKKYIEIEHKIAALNFSYTRMDSCVLAMAQWVENEIGQMPTTPQENTIVLSLLVYGKDYIDKALAVTFRSLLAEGNIPALCARKNVIFHVQTDAHGQAQFESSDDVKRMLAMGVSFVYAVIPSEILSNLEPWTLYWMVGTAATIAYAYATRINAAFHHSYPDIFYSDRYFEELLRLSESSPAILAPAHRTDEALFLASIKPYDRQESCIAICAADLAALALNAIHMCQFPCLVSNRGMPWRYPKDHVLMWEGEETLYFNAPHLNAVWLSSEITSRSPIRFYISFDSELDLVVDGENYYIPQAHDDLYLTEFSAQGKYRVSDVWLDAINYADNFWSLITNRDCFKFFARGMKVKINRTIRPKPANCMAEKAIDAEQAYLFNAIASRDPAPNSGLGRQRTHSGRIYFCK